jgi:hypothetical protein
MEAFDLRAVSSVAPRGDLIVGALIMFFAALVAHGALIFKLFPHSPRAALTVLLAFLLGIFAVAATLAVRPPRIYLASVLYIAAFVLVSHIATRGLPGKYASRRWTASGAAIMFIGVAFAWWIAVAPR